jgi:WD40 repeat protein
MTAKCYFRFGFPLAALAFLTGQVVGQIMQHEAEVKAAQFSPDGRWVVTASKDSLRSDKNELCELIAVRSSSSKWKAS